MSQRAHEAFFDIHPVTGATIEVFYADRSLETFGWRGAGWFWWPRRRGFAPTGQAIGPFPTSYSAYRDALHSPLSAGEYSAASAPFGRRAYAESATVLPYCFQRTYAWKQQALPPSKMYSFQRVDGAP